MFFSLFTYQRVRVEELVKFMLEYTINGCACTASSIGMQTATEQMISKIDEKE